MEEESSLISDLNELLDLNNIEGGNDARTSQTEVQGVVPLEAETNLCTDETDDQILSSGFVNFDSFTNGSDILCNENSLRTNELNSEKKSVVPLTVEKNSASGQSEPFLNPICMENSGSEQSEPVSDQNDSEPNSARESWDVVVLDESVPNLEATQNTPDHDSSSSLVDVQLQSDALVSKLENEDTPMLKVTEMPEFVELKSLCQHLQKMLEQQLEERERLQAQNERLNSQLIQERNRGQVSTKVSPDKQHQEGTQQNIKDLVTENSRLRKELDAAKVILVNQEAVLTRELNHHQAERAAKFDQLNKSYEECRKEKELMVIRYAQAEQKNIELQDKLQKSETRIREWTKEREVAMSKWHGMRNDNLRMIKLIETKDAEIVSLKKDVEYHKELSSSGELQVKYYQQKAKEQEDTSKETKSKFEELKNIISTNREDFELLRNELNALGSSIQVLNMTGSVTMLPQIKLRLECAIKKREARSEDDIPLSILEDLHVLVSNQKDLVEESIRNKDKLANAEQECLFQKEVISQLEERLCDQQLGNEDLINKTSNLEKTKQILEQEMTKVHELENRSSELELVNKELQLEMESKKKREAESLEFTSRLSDKNTSLQSENLQLVSEVEMLRKERDSLAAHGSYLESENKQLVENRLDAVKCSQLQLDLQSKQLQEKTQEVHELRLKVTDMEDELRSTKRQNAANIKDLTRQLQLTSKRLEGYDKSADNVEQVQGRPDLNSRRSSDSSCDNVTQKKSSSQDCSDSQEQEDYIPPVVRVVEVNQQMFLEKIVKLQRMLARRNEKIDFLEDHVGRLLDEIRKKSRIILNYAQREETGTLATNVSDKVKVQLSKKGGIMASLYSSQLQDGSMTVELALEICHKLQAVLEDTLLKNIALKESLEMLGKQVDTLLKENERLRTEQPRKT